MLSSKLASCCLGRAPAARKHRTPWCWAWELASPALGSQPRASLAGPPTRELALGVDELGGVEQRAAGVALRAGRGWRQQPAVAVGCRVACAAATEAHACAPKQRGKRAPHSPAPGRRARPRTCTWGRCRSQSCAGRRVGGCATDWVGGGHSPKRRPLAELALGTPVSPCPTSWRAQAALCSSSVLCARMRAAAHRSARNLPSGSLYSCSMVCSTRQPRSCSVRKMPCRERQRARKAAGAESGGWRLEQAVPASKAVPAAAMTAPAAPQQRQQAGAPGRSRSAHAWACGQTCRSRCQTTRRWTAGGGGGGCEQAGEAGQRMQAVGRDSRRQGSTRSLAPQLWRCCRRQPRVSGLQTACSPARCSIQRCMRAPCGWRGTCRRSAGRSAAPPAPAGGGGRSHDL